MTIVKEITSILNNDKLSFSEKLSALRDVRDHRRGNNKMTVLIILDILHEYYLPINNEKFDEGKRLFKDANDVIYSNIKSIGEADPVRYFFHFI